MQSMLTLDNGTRDHLGNSDNLNNETFHLGCGDDNS